MGQWNITIQGHGIHDNNCKDEDADQMLRAFVADLRRVGHTVEAVWFTTGYARDEDALIRTGVKR